MGETPDEIRSAQARLSRRSVVQEMGDLHRRLDELDPRPRILIEPRRVYLLHLNYSVLGTFGSEEGALAEAVSFMNLHDGEWTKTSPLMLQWFHAGIGHVEIVAHEVQR